jgi:hypothetical protein
MSSEPEWTKRFSNETVCNYYYYLSVALLIIGVINVSIFIYLIVKSKGAMKGYFIGVLISQLIMLGIGYFIYLFAYLTCTRSLVDKKQ